MQRARLRRALRTDQEVLAHQRRGGEAGCSNGSTQPARGGLGFLDLGAGGGIGSIGGALGTCGGGSGLSVFRRMYSPSISSPM
jgi:hypothetical protein